MALQRTRRPRLRSGRSLRSLGPPLNARSLGGGGLSLCLLSLALFTGCTPRTTQQPTAGSPPRSQPRPTEIGGPTVLVVYRDGSGLPGVIVALCPGGDPGSPSAFPQATTNASGVARFMTLRPGTYFARAYLAGLRMEEKRPILNVSPSGSGSLTIRMEVWADGGDVFVPVTPKPTPSPCEDAA
jgi:hypothetical protein